MIKREIMAEIRPWFKKEKILILNGSRQVGKTTILKEFKKELEKQDDLRVVYLLADEIDNEPILSSLSSLELYLKQFYDFDKKQIYLMIDEFQVIKNAGLFLKNIFDKHKDKIQLIVSGSSSLEINKNSEFLTGRAIHFNIERINFKEYFDYVNKIKTERMSLKFFADLETFYNTFKIKLNTALNEYLIFGAYPEIITTDSVDDKKVILKSIIKTYIDKDIINQLNVENVSGFNNLIKILSSQIGQMINSHEISNTIGLSANTLKKYLDILVGTYIYSLVTPFYKNIRSEISKMPKGYLLDLGIRNYLLRDFGFDNNTARGEVIENFVYLSLLSQFNKEYLHYYRTISGSEIDFIIEKDDAKKILCEVKYRSKVGDPLAFKNFEKKYKGEVDKKIVVTKDLIKKEKDTYFLPVGLINFVDFLK
jgi:predicted AAA+ superfamily ATPase